MRDAGVFLHVVFNFFYSYLRPRNISNALIAIARIKIVTAINSKFTASSKPSVILPMELFTDADVSVVIS